jgi:hypothetical protein
MIHQPDGSTDKDHETRAGMISILKSPPAPRVDAGVQKPTKVKIGRIVDPENPVETRGS